MDLSEDRKKIGFLLFSFTGRFYFLLLHFFFCHIYPSSPFREGTYLLAGGGERGTRIFFFLVVGDVDTFFWVSFISFYSLMAEETELCWRFFLRVVG